MRRFLLIDDYLAEKAVEMGEGNAKLVAAGREPVNMRRSTIIGVLRALQTYLETHPRVRQNMTLLVRQLQPTEAGLKLAIYAVTATVACAHYEAIQADIFDRVLAILPEFSLRLFQQTVGAGFRSGRTGAQSGDSIVERIQRNHRSGWGRRLQSLDG